LKKFLTKKIPAKFLFLAGGLLATIWFLVRVIPKPSRATYPCMRAAAPLMSGFIIYLLSLAASVVAFRKAKDRFLNARYAAAALFVLTGMVVAYVAFVNNGKPAYANPGLLLSATQPIGEARGIYPGRVVWSWEPNATNENLTNAFGDAHDLAHNTDLRVVESMCADAINSLTGAENIEAAWDTLFRFFNANHNKGAVPYTEGEKIFIKVNFVGGHRNRLNDDHSRKEHGRYGNSQTTPQVAMVVLRQLINDCGIPQENIFIGDPSKNIYKNTWDIWTSEFPDVNYIAQYGEMGRGKAMPGQTPSIFYSDKGTVMNSPHDYLCSALEEADYLINIGALKGHAVAGITLNAKNHFGSRMEGGASYLHPGLVGFDNNSTGYGKYRAQVDFMGHQLLGGNTLLFLIDGLYSGPDANLQPVKWKMYPFSNDWTSSIFVSQDGVAIEAVCYDFLRTEYTAENSEYPFPQLEGTEDYLLQAADSTYWPEGLIYDPENDGEAMQSMGVYEQWNNAYDMDYSRNLGTGDGIELIKIFSANVPLTPQNLQYELHSENSITLTWDLNASKTTHYVIEQSIGDMENFEQIAILDSSVSTCEIEGNFHTDLFYYRIMAINQTSHSSYSTYIEVTAAIPAAPVNLTGVVIDCSQVCLSWDAGSTTETSYVIERAYRFGSPFVPIDTVSADSTQYTATDLQASSYYAFRVKALNLDFESEYSNVFSLVTDAVAVPAMLADEKNTLNVFPNPFAGFCYVSLKSPYVGQIEVSVINLQGEKIQENSFVKSQELFNQQMNLSELPVGIYMIEVRCKNSRLVKTAYKF
jgi:hypothetical protein